MTNDSHPKHSLDVKLNNLFIHGINKCSEFDKKKLEKQFQLFDKVTLNRQITLITEGENNQLKEISPLVDVSFAGHSKDSLLGLKLISEGKVACLIVAGGQGTRLNFNGPKGMYPVSLIEKKSLFQIFSEKVVAAGSQVNQELPLAIMTSPLNHQETVNFFNSHKYFGLNPNQVDFFSQDMLPFLTNDGNLIRDKIDNIAVGPDGNGRALQHLVKHGIWDKWSKQGVESVVFILIDNPLADPFDSELIGFLQREKLDIVVKCIERKDPLEKVGVLIKEENHLNVIEYSELSELEKVARLADGSLKYRCANLSLFGFSMDFIKRMETSDLPLHKSLKISRQLNDQDVVIEPSSANIWKYEYYIFDLLRHSHRIKALLYPREQCFAPLKNATGNDSLQTVQTLLLNKDKKTLSEITKTDVPDILIELDQAFYYPTEELRNKWNGRKIEKSGYINP